VSSTSGVCPGSLALLSMSAPALFPMTLLSQTR
jgi:hypothetical protein